MWLKENYIYDKVINYLFSGVGLITSTRKTKKCGENIVHLHSKHYGLQ